MKHYKKKQQLSHLMAKPTKWLCAQWRLRSAWASAQADQSLLSAWRKLGSLATHWAHSEDSDQTGRMPRLIWVFTGCTCHFVGFVMRRLNLSLKKKIKLGQSFNLSGSKPDDHVIFLKSLPFLPHLLDLAWNDWKNPDRQYSASLKIWKKKIHKEPKAMVEPLQDAINLSILINWTSPFPILGFLVYFFFFILFRIDIFVSKQWRPWSDAVFCGVWSGSALFAYVPKMGH